MTTHIDYQFAWAAGLFEGEGSVLPPQSTGTTPKIQLTTTDKDIAYRYRDVVGGTVYGPIERQNKEWKDVYRHQLSGWNNVKEVYLKFQPYLGERRSERFELAIKDMPEKDQRPIESCGYTVDNSQNGYNRHYKNNEVCCFQCQKALRNYARIKSGKEPKLNVYL